MGCRSELSGLAFQYLCDYMAGIDLSPKMVDKSAERECYNVLLVGNAESVVLLTAAADHPTTLNSP